MSNEDFEAFKQAWLDIPSQDNEGYIPERGAFKSGWFAALEWERKRNKTAPTQEPELPQWPEAEGNQF